MRSGQHQFTHLDFLGPQKISSAIVNGSTVTDTIYHSIADFTFNDLNGNAISFGNQPPSYWVFHFFNTGCAQPCPDVFRNLFDVVRDFKEAPKVKFLSITTQPQNDSISVLTMFEKLNGVKAPQWLLCRGDSLSVDSLMRNSFFLSGNAGNQALSQVFLVDPNRHLRGIYDGSDLMDMRRLKDEIKVLSYETRKNRNK